MSNKISVEGPIKIETSEKKTSLIKRKEDKLPECKKSTNKDKDNLRYSLHWDYTTNKSGSQQFTFTGKEMGDNFWSQETKNKLKMGDLVIYKKSGHPNTNSKARIYAKTGLISQVEALKKGVIEKLPELPDTYDIKFIAPPVIAGNRIKRIKGVKKEEIEKIPGYRFFFCYPTAKKDSKYSYHSPQFHEKIKSEMKKGFVKKMDWKVNRIQAKHAGVTKDPLTGKAIPADKLVEQPNSVKFKIGGVELIEISDPVHLYRDKPEKEVHKIRALVHLRLEKVVDEVGKKAITEVDGEKVMSILDCKNHKKRTIELINELREESAKQAASFSEYLGDKLTVKYAKNLKDVKWYQDKTKKEIEDKFYKKRMDKQKEEIKKRQDHRGDWKKKKEEEVKKSKEVLEHAKDEAKREQTEIEQKFDAKRAKDDVMDEIKEKAADKSTSGLKGEPPYVKDFNEGQKKQRKEREDDLDFIGDGSDDEAVALEGVGGIKGGTRKQRKRKNRRTKKRRNKNK